MTLSQITVLFLIYSVVGWISEVIYCSILDKCFVNRGFLYGPWCPIYGFGALLIIWLLKPFMNTWITLFFVAMILTSILEYISGLILEKLFNTKWWDYSSRKFNIHGRVCLRNSTLFGLMAVGLMHFLHPVLIDFLNILSEEATLIISYTFIAIFSADFILSLKHIIDFTVYISRLHQYMDEIKDRLNEEGFDFKDISSLSLYCREKFKSDKERFSESFITRFDEFIAKKNRFRRLLLAFPYMSSVKYLKAVDQMKKEVIQKKQLLKKAINDTKESIKEKVK